MDYDQDYSKINATDNQWYDPSNSQTPVSSESAETTSQPVHGNRRRELTADMLDCEDFD